MKCFWKWNHEKAIISTNRFSLQINLIEFEGSRVGCTEMSYTLKRAHIPPNNWPSLGERLEDKLQLQVMSKIWCTNTHHSTYFDCYLYISTSDWKIFWEKKNVLKSCPRNILLGNLIGVIKTPTWTQRSVQTGELYGYQGGSILQFYNLTVSFKAN